MRSLKSSTRTDPAPSRWSYRVQRWWLTPALHKILRIGLPILLVVCAVAGVIGNADRRADIAASIQDLRRQIETRPEFMVNLLAVEGASAVVETEIRELFPNDLPASSFDIDLKAIRDLIIDLAPVAEASVRLRQGGVLVVNVKERVPVAIWRTRGGLALIDGDGVALTLIGQRKDRPDLPVIAGHGADRSVAEAISLLQAAGPIAERVRGLIRVGERRWDVVLDRGQRILLPEHKPVRALERVIVLAELQDLLGRDLSIVDTRLTTRPTIRLSQHAMSELWRIKQTSTDQKTGVAE
ncbi:MAG: cell division protein FtsQ/DivIB [Pseudomonadota bacterium]